MCTVGGAPTGDMIFAHDRVKGKRYRCNECGEKFTQVIEQKTHLSQLPVG